MDTSSPLRRLDRERCAAISTVVAVPVLLAAIDWISELSRSSDTEFLLVPPLGVIVYLIFSRPDADYVAFRSIVLMPVIGAVAGQVAYRFLGLTPFGVAAAAIVVLSAQKALRAYMPPAIALSILAMLLRAHDIGYSVSVALATLFVGGIFWVWRKVVWQRLPPRVVAVEERSDRDEQRSVRE